MKTNNSFEDTIRSIVKEENQVLLKKVEKLVKNISNFTQEDEILNFTEACGYLSCSKSYLYKQTSANQIPHSKRGKRLFFEKTKLTKWVLENRIKTEDELICELDNNLIYNSNKSNKTQKL